MATFVVAIAAAGCATPEAPTSGVSATSTAQTIGDVSVVRDGEGSVVTLAGLIDPIYSVTASGDETLLVIDLVGVGKREEGDLGAAAAGEGQQVVAYDGVVDLVTISTYDEDGGTPLTRVEILTTEAASADVLSTEDGLTVRVTPTPIELGNFDATTSWQTEEIPVEGTEVSFDAEPEAVPVVAAPPTATILTGVSAQVTDGGVLVGLSTDGGIGTLEAFTLEDPARLVVDLPGITAASTAANVSVDSALVTGVRLGAHADKVRVVIDGGSEVGDFSGRQIMPATTGLWIAVGGGETLAQAVTEALDAADAAWIASATASPTALEDDVAVSEEIPVGIVSADTTPIEGAPEETAPVEVASEEAAPVEVASEDTTGIEVAEASPVDGTLEDTIPTVVASEDTAPIEKDEPALAAESTVIAELAEGADYEEVTSPEIAPEAVPAALAEAPTEAVELDSPVLAEVYGLHYERTEEFDRTAILADDTLAYTTSQPDAGTYVISIPGAQISPDASDRIFPKAGGPVSMIHAFQQPEVETPEVRVVFTRAPNQEPVISRRGSMLFVEFQDTGLAAATPPAFPNAGGEEEALGLTVTGSPALPVPVAEAAPVAPENAPSTTPLAAVPMTDPYALDAPVPAPTDLTSEPTPVAAIATPVAPIEVAQAAAAPGFEQGGAIDAVDPNAMWDAPQAASVAPAAVEVPAAIEVLEEGGLIDGKEYRGRRVSLDFKGVAIADVLRLIAEVSDLNIIAGDEVSGNVTIRLVDVPWDQALDVILMTKGLGFVRVGNVLRIAPSDVLKAEEEVRLQERRNKEKLEDLEVKLLPVNYASVKDTAGLVKRLLSARGTVNLDERTNTLIIKDIASVIDEASALIAAIDTQTPQVMIEAKIVEASLDFSRELGSVWGIQTQRFTDPFDPDTPRTDLDFANDGINLIDENSLSFANPIAAVPTGLLTVGALILDQDFRVDAQIQAAEATGDGKVVSSPRIVTLDNTEARIEQGVSIPFQTFEGGDAKLEFIDAVLSLIVTPHITADESVIMQIQVSRNAPDDSVQTPTGSPAIARNEANTETLVKDGQTLVLGGIYTITKSNTQSRIPYLHRIPVIGNAFKSNAVTDSRKELLVFVTPRIVRLPEMAAN
ncbi:MAG: type IV pilus secretin PilQ [Myxococcota bacterium]